LGLGWNFMFVGGSTLLTGTYRVSERAKAQGLHDLLVFGTTAASSFASGLILKANGWTMLNYVALPFITLAGVAVLWLMLRPRAATT
jgi:MFS family permease